MAELFELPQDHPLNIKKEAETQADEAFLPEEIALFTALDATALQKPVAQRDAVWRKELRRRVIGQDLNQEDLIAKALRWHEQHILE